MDYLKKSRNNKSRNNSRRNNRSRNQRAGAVKSECAGKVKSDCVEPCQWKSGEKRQYCAMGRSKTASKQESRTASPVSRQASPKLPKSPKVTKAARAEALRAANWCLDQPHDICVVSDDCQWIKPTTTKTGKVKPGYCKMVKKAAKGKQPAPVEEEELVIPELELEPEVETPVKSSKKTSVSKLRKSASEEYKPGYCLDLPIELCEQDPNCIYTKGYTNTKTGKEVAGRCSARKGTRGSLKYEGPLPKSLQTKTYDYYFKMNVSASPEATFDEIIDWYMSYYSTWNKDVDERFDHFTMKKLNTSYGTSFLVSFESNVELSDRDIEIEVDTLANPDDDVNNPLHGEPVSGDVTIYW
jgi:hypothetical protein